MNRASRTGGVLIYSLALIHAAAASGAWEFERVEVGAPGKFSSMKIDAKGNLHVAYVVDDGNRMPLRYAFRDQRIKKWFTMTVAEYASFCSLAIDSNLRPHISYADHGTGSGAKLRYAHWDGSAWKKQAIPVNSDVVAYYTSIVLDTKDRPIISFYEYRGPKDSDIRIRLRNVMWTGEYWQVRTVDPQEGSGKFNFMAAAGDLIHLAYANVSAQTASARYALWNGREWVREIVDGFAENNGQTVGFSIAVAVDKQGIPHLTYMNDSASMVKYAVRKAGVWKVEVVEALDRVAYPDRNSIALDDQDRPYLGYYDSGRGILRMAHWDGREWIRETVDENVSGLNSSLQIGHGSVWISYSDGANGGVKVAHRPLGESAPGSSASANK